MTITLLTVAQVARQAQVHPVTIRRAIHAGQLEAFYIGAELRIRSEAAEGWMLARPVRSKGSRVRSVRRRAGRGPGERGGFAHLMSIEGGG